MTAPAPGSPGPLAAEAAQLLDVLADRLATLQPAARASGPGEETREQDGPTPDQHAPTSQRGPEHDAGMICTTGCPFCQVLAVVRGERPETAARLVDGALLVVRSLRTLLDRHVPAGAPAPSPSPSAEPATPHDAGDGPSGAAADPAPPGSGAARRARVEWIDVR